VVDGDIEHLGPKYLSFMPAAAEIEEAGPDAGVEYLG
jgi:hypothetical protein